MARTSTRHEFSGTYGDYLLAKVSKVFHSFASRVRHSAVTPPATSVMRTAAYDPLQPVALLKAAICRLVTESPRRRATAATAER